MTFLVKCYQNTFDHCSNTFLYEKKCFFVSNLRNLNSKEPNETFRFLYAFISISIDKTNCVDNGKGSIRKTYFKPIWSATKAEVSYVCARIVCVSLDFVNCISVMNHKHHIDSIKKKLWLHFRKSLRINFSIHWIELHVYPKWRKKRRNWNRRYNRRAPTKIGPDSMEN